MSRKICSGLFIALLAAILTATPTVRAQTTWYIDDDALADPCPGDPNCGDPLEDGSADHPFDAIQEGINAAVDGDTVLVLDGTYTGDGNRDLDFAGGAITLRSENGPDVCIIDCQGGSGELHRAFDFHSGESAGAVVNGFTVTGGYVDGDGGGISCENSSPTITNCTIMGNETVHPYGDGGGIYCYSSSPTINSCTITGNWSAYFGAGVYCYDSSATINNCTIAGNSNDSGGGGVCCDDSSPTITNCTITGNSAHQGAGVHCDDSSPTITNCTISGNSTTLAGGGGVRCSSSNATITNCAITGNFAMEWGGGVSCDVSAPVISNCTISENSAAGGAGIDCMYSSARISNCTISGNWTTVGSGGGVYCSHSNVRIGNCTISGNRSRYGGGVYCEWWSPTLTNCAISGNSTDEDGGGIYCAHSNATMTNCTISANSASGRAGALYCSYDGTPAFSNCILWANTPEEIHVESGSATASYSDVQGGWPGEGNIDADPLFVDPDGPDDDPNTWQDNNYRLSAGSPGIDASDNTAVPADIADLDDDGDVTERTPLDLAGIPRFRDDPDTEDTGVPDPPEYPEIVDMGAYEFHLAGDLDGDGDIDADDFLLFVAAFGQCIGDLGYRAEADLDGDGCVTLVDYQLWMQLYRDFVGDPAASAPGLGIPGDLNGDGCIDLSDLAMLLANYGTTSGATFADGDSNADGDVDLSDLSALLAVYGPSCP